MKIALISDQPHASSRVADAYTLRTVEACARAAGADVEFEVIPAVTEKQPDAKAPVLKVLREHRQGLLDRIDAYGPDAVVSMGSAALSALEGAATTVRKEHGRMRWLELNDDKEDYQVPWTPTVAPWQVVKGYDLHRDFAGVIFKAITQPAPLPALAIETFVPVTAEELEACLAELEGATVVGVDVETGGLKPHSDELLAIGIGAVYSDLEGVAVVVTPELFEQPWASGVLFDAIWRRSRRSVGHNFKFDMQFMERWIGWPPREALIGDTLLLAHLIDERPTRPDSRARGSGLKDLVAQRYDHQYGFDFDGFYAAEEDEKVVRTDALHVYLGEDVCYTARLWLDEVRDADEESPRLLELHDRLLVPVSRAVARAELAGAPVDVAWVRQTMSDLELEAAGLRATLESQLPSLVGLTVTVDNILSPTQVADLMYGAWGWTPDVRRHGKLIADDRSTDQDHVKAAVAKYSKVPSEAARVAWIEDLVRLRKDVKLSTTYQKSLLDRRDDDDRVRASFLLHGASTGRISAREPAIQTIPAVDDREPTAAGWRYKLRDMTWTERPMRRAFAPRNGRLWVEADYSQLELRVAAGISGDPDFTAVFTSGRDVHREVAAGIFNRAPEDISKPERYLAKAVAFGIIYGRTAKALAGGEEMDYAERDLGMTRWTEDVAQVFIDSFLMTYPRLTEWIAERHSVDPARGYVESPLGRRRRFPLGPRTASERGSIERQAVNTPIQGTASDICLEAFARISEGIEDLGLDAAALFPVHDSICIEVAPSDLKALEKLCRETMEVEFMGVPLKIDFEYGESWADVQPDKPAEPEPRMEHSLGNHSHRNSR